MMLLRKKSASHFVWKHYMIGDPGRSRVLLEFDRKVRGMTWLLWSKFHFVHCQTNHKLSWGNLFLLYLKLRGPRQELRLSIHSTKKLSLKWCRLLRQADSRMDSKGVRIQRRPRHQVHSGVFKGLGKTSFCVSNFEPEQWWRGERIHFQTKRGSQGRELRL